VTASTLERLRRERDAIGIGPEIHAHVSSLVGRISRSYDPRIYASVGTWSDGLDDLVQEVVTDRLLGEGQLDYALDVADSLESFTNLIANQIRRTLARRRRRSVVDNLLERAREALREPDFVGRQAAGRTLFHRSGSTVEERQATEAELRRAAVAVAEIPTLRSHATERAPAVYTHEAFDMTLVTIADSLSTEFAVADLDAIFRLVLTDWIASDLAISREGVSEPPDRSLGPQEAIEVEAIVELITAALPVEAAPVLRLKYAGHSDQEVAATLGLSRPTVAKRKQQAFDVIREQLSDSDERIQDAVVGALWVRLEET
jgi:hypothetical protein